MVRDQLLQLQVWPDNRGDGHVGRQNSKPKRLWLADNVKALHSDPSLSSGSVLPSPKIRLQLARVRWKLPKGFSMLQFHVCRRVSGQLFNSYKMSMRLATLATCVFMLQDLTQSMLTVQQVHGCQRCITYHMAIVGCIVTTAI